MLVGLCRRGCRGPWFISRSILQACHRRWLTFAGRLDTIYRAVWTRVLATAWQREGPFASWAELYAQCGETRPEGFQGALHPSACSQFTDQHLGIRGRLCRVASAVTCHRSCHGRTPSFGCHPAYAWNIRPRPSLWHLRRLAEYI